MLLNSKSLSITEYLASAEVTSEPYNVFKKPNKN